MATQFGATWWGQAYLGALTQIDWENRLARGKSYARNENILDIKIHDNIVEAQVQGRNPKPYQVQMVHIPLLPGDQKKLTKALAVRPDLISDILNSRLPEELNEICKAEKIKIFPESWRDIKLNCSCPDWAVPCKHLAAVIYTLANEIDKDPFLVFKLLKFDLVDALKQKGFTISETDQPGSIPSLHGFFSEEDLPRGIPIFQQSIYDSIDLSSIPNIGVDIPLFLDPRPVFYHDADFRTILEQSYRRLAAYVTKNERDQKELAAKFSMRRLKQIDYLEIILDEDFRLNALWFEGLDEAHTFSMSSLEGIIDMILAISTAELSQLAEDFRLVYLAYDIARGLMKQGAIMPAIYQLQNESIRIRWEPCMNIQSVRQIVNDLQQILRYDFISIETSHDELVFLKKDTQAFTLISLFLGHLVKMAMSRIKMPEQDRIHSLFFENKTQQFKKFSEQKIGQSIRQWLDILSYTGHGFRPMIRIDEVNEKRFGLNLDLENHHRNPPEIISLAAFMEDSRYQADRLQMLKILSLLSDKLPALKELIKGAGKDRIILTEEAIIGFLDHIKGVMQLTQAKILLPKSLETILKPKASIRISTGSSVNTSGLLSLDNLLRFEWKIALGDHLVSVHEFEKMMNASGRLIKVKDRYVLLDKKEIQSLLLHLSKAKSPNGLDLLRYAITEEFEGNKISLSEDVKKFIHRIRNQKSVALPKKLNAELRPYQKRGFEWLYKNAQLGFGSILADDMGLGKTVQVLTFLQKSKEEGLLNDAPVLIVAPATLLTNWVRECERFTPQLRPFVYHGTGRKIPKGKFDLLITTYGLARADQKKLAAIPWIIMVIDEAQYIKNTAASQTRAVFDIPAKIRIAMSGTPVENRLMEYYSISQFANPGYLNTATAFRQDFANPIERHRDQQRLNLFKRMTSPFLLRRLKTDKTIIKDLPDKIVINRHITLTPEQVSLYEACTKEALQLIESASDQITRRGLVLRMLLQLKQICNHPRNFLKRGNYQASRTGKAEALFEIISQVQEEGSKVLIFTQYREMGDILIEMLRECGEDGLFLHGGLSRKERDEIVRAFQEDHWPNVLVLSIKAAGTGLNLTAATHVIHYDLWWNPAVEAQATDRAFRIGQKHNVTVHRIITKNTLEENIDRLMDQKRDLANLTVSTGEKWIGDLSDREIEGLVGLRK
ncbi:MAG: SNF2-related protein [Saprospiraceae bacterium]